MADTGTTILNLPATAALNDTDVLPLARPSGTTAPGSDLGMSGAALKAIITALAAKGGLFRGSFAANAVYGQYDGIIIPAGAPSAGLFAFATVAFTAAAAYSPANWTLDPGQSTNDYTTTEKTKLAALTPAAPLYGATGTHTDGAMTQAAVTAGLFFDFNNEPFTNGAGPFPLVARQSNVVSGNNGGTTYNLPTTSAATYLAFRLQYPPYENLPLTITFAGGTLENLTTLTMQPGDWRIIAKQAGANTAWSTIWSSRGTTPATASTAGVVKIGSGVTVTADGTISVAAGTGGDTFSVMPYAATLAVDFNAETVRTLAATGNIAYGPSVNIALLKTKEHYITNTTGAAITLAFPAGWTFFPGPAPTSLAAGKQAVLTLRSLGTTDATIKAAYVAQA